MRKFTTSFLSDKIYLIVSLFFFSFISLYSSLDEGYIRVLIYFLLF